MDKIIKIGTRGSELALWQARHVADLLKNEGLLSEIVPIETKGDKILNKSISKIGSKGVFTEELEMQLRDGTIDIAVHSAKDVQSSLDEDLELIAFLEREKANDVIVSFNKDFSLEKSYEIVLGTSSTRRIALVKNLYPKMRTVGVRGNLQTRMRKLEEGLCDALVLAYAGVIRMKFEKNIVRELPIDTFVPAVGQGSIAVEMCKKFPEQLKHKIRAALNHPDTELCIKAERYFLRKMEGGCSVPVFAHAELLPEGLFIRGGVVSLDGVDKVVFDFLSVSKNDREAGIALADLVLENGGKKILEDIREKSK